MHGCLWRWRRKELIYLQESMKQSMHCIIGLYIVHLCENVLYKHTFKKIKIKANVNGQALNRLMQSYICYNVREDPTHKSLYDPVTKIKNFHVSLSYRAPVSFFWSWLKSMLCHPSTWWTHLADISNLYILNLQKWDWAVQKRPEKEATLLCLQSGYSWIG